MSDKLRMQAYYYSFDETGVRTVDEVLSAVATAGKMYHHTEEWAEESNREIIDIGKLPVEMIQESAEACAATIRALEAEVERLRGALQFYGNAYNHDPLWHGGATQSQVADDHGARARAALAPKDGGEG